MAGETVMGSVQMYEIWAPDQHFFYYAVKVRTRLCASSGAVRLSAHEVKRRPWIVEEVHDMAMRFEGAPRA